ncbi:glycosylhydrolase-like jelly roll fold domain-containing protein [Paenibacillus sp. Aloe-11]|uniref:glycosylhydrolase-like jelly roll fold domain-containing protein n=1 Tax=Paenibacillus sp. Aloe-11 TaxID=1050222 RepID=UPI00024F03C6|nr:glycosylhydrolase-like jelly roll fold domain-containing protein [Paenibacillus sp. Aloe-11]EHS57545.1 glycoside hydrolase family 2 protein [Paenibacillus sp. Aloe-11]
MKRLTDVLENKQDNYIFPLFWIHGEEEEILREAVGKVQDAGIQALCVESRPHPDFVGELWWRDMDIIMDEARNRGMKVWLLDDSHFPTGYANGKIVSDYPQHAKKYLKIHQLDFVGPLKDSSFLVKWGSPGNRMSLDLKPVPIQDEILGIVAARRTGENSVDPLTLQDVTSFEKNGVLYWDIPEGDWRIFIMLQTVHGGEPHTDGYLNPLDPEAVKILIEEVYEPHYQHYKHDFGKTFAGFFSDEPRFGNMHGAFGAIGRAEMVFPWKEGLLEKFTPQERLQLPLLSTVEAQGTEHSIRFKYMDMISRMYGESFTGTLAAWCRERGVEYIGHLIEDNNAHARLGYGAGHFFRAIWEQDMSGIDVVLNQIMPGMDKGTFKSMTAKGWDGEFFHYGLAKMGTSLGHLDPKKNNRTLCEVYGAYGWAEGIKLMKWITDHMLVRGVTHFVPHAFSPKEFPDPDCPPHLDARGHNPQYRFMRELFNYLNRVSHLLNGGEHVAPVGLLYHAEAEWLGDYMLFQKPARELMQHQIDFDVVPVDLIVEAEPEGNEYKINGKAFRVLVIPYAEALPQRLLTQVKTLTDAGIPVYFMDGLPVRNEYGEAVDPLLLAGAAIKKLSDFAVQLQEEGISDIRTSEFQPYLRYYHYQQEDGNLYMFFNEDPYRIIETKVTLSTGKQIAAYDGFDNRLKSIPQTLENGKRIVSLTLQPYESIVVFESGEAVETGRETAKELAIIHGPWNISFSTAEAYPHFSSQIVLDSLQDISRLEGRERFSGTVRYELSIDLEEEVEDVRIDLGRVYEVAEVTINGRYLGVKICPPYIFEVGDALRKGKNEIIIEVTNNLGKQEQDFLSQYMIQEPTGLLGPVRLLKSYLAE